ncbi:MAG TPA: GreA/GreB family elongation factor [Thermoleophilaceae bacterium]|jgi:transcription elongation factor GreA|nr:GreA/GreB family elongation factor [Thermoleophilaceae bacterium]
MTVDLGLDVSFRDVKSGAEESFHLVPAGRSDVAHRMLAADSPVGRALLGHEPGETVEVHVPTGTRRLLITAVHA